MVEEIYDTGYSIIWKDDLEIIHCEYYKDIEIEIDHAKREMNIISKLFYGKKLRIIINFGPVRAIDKRVRDFYSSTEAAYYISASAFVTNSSIHPDVQNYFFGSNKLSFPVKIFTYDHEAVEWLMSKKVDLMESMI